MITLKQFIVQSSGLIQIYELLIIFRNENEGIVSKTMYSSQSRGFINYYGE